MATLVKQYLTSIQINPSFNRSIWIFSVHNCYTQQLFLILLGVNEWMRYMDCSWRAISNDRKVIKVDACTYQLANAVYFYVSSDIIHHCAVGL